MAIDARSMAAGVVIAAAAVIAVAVRRRAAAAPTQAERDRWTVYIREAALAAPTSRMVLMYRGGEPGR